MLELCPDSLLRWNMSDWTTGKKGQRSFWKRDRGLPSILYWWGGCTTVPFQLPMKCSHRWDKCHKFILFVHGRRLSLQSRYALWFHENMSHAKDHSGQTSSDRQVLTSPTEFIEGLMSLRKENDLCWCVSWQKDVVSVHVQESVRRVKAIKRTVVNAFSLRREGSTMLENVVVTRASHKSCRHGRDKRCGYVRPFVALVLGRW